jgi:hypothetical protein
LRDLLLRRCLAARFGGGLFLHVTQQVAADHLDCLICIGGRPVRVVLEGQVYVTVGIDEQPLEIDDNATGRLADQMIDRVLLGLERTEPQGHHRTGREGHTWGIRQLG